MCLQVRLNESDMKTLTREELCSRCVKYSCYVTIYKNMSSEADFMYLYIFLYLGGSSMRLTSR